MSLMITIIVVVTELFSAFALFIMLLEKRKKNVLDKHLGNIDKQQKLILYQSGVLKKIQENSRNRLDVEKIIQIITENLSDVVQYATISSLVLGNNKLNVKTTIKTPVNQAFVNKVKESMIQSISELSEAPLSFNVDEQINGVLSIEFTKFPLASFFHIPILVNGKVIALITIASSEPNCFDEDAMTCIYKVTDLATQSLSSLETVMNVEKGKLIAMISSLGDGVFMVDRNNQITVINDAAKNFLHILKDNPSLIDVLSSLPGQYDFNNKIQLVFIHNEALEEKDVAIGDKSFQIQITPVEDLSDTSAHHVVGVSVLLHDITFEKSVAKMKEDFTHVMVHELRSPLTSMKATAQLLNSPVKLPDEEKTKLLLMISQQCSKLLEEVSLILDAAKLESGLFTVEKVISDLKALIQERITLFTNQANEKSVSFLVDIDPALQNFAFDPNHLGQVFNNIISNSLKFTPSGGKISISVKQLADKVTIAVSDTGMGIPKDKQHLLFSKFSQIASPNTHIGSGLGLYFVKGIVEAHGGTVSLESEEGKGTTITINLPLNEEKQKTTGQ
jgi:signal transduction histidine kinase